MNTTARGSLIVMAILGTIALAFSIPFIISGGNPETHPDIVLEPRHTATPTPLDRALTREAFANLFFTPTDTSVALLSNTTLATNTPIPTSTLTETALIPVSGNSTLTPSSTPLQFTPTSRGGGGGPNNSPTPLPSFTPRNTSTPIPSRTPTLRPTSTRTATLLPTSTPLPPTPTDTPKPTKTPKKLPTDTPLPPTPTNPPPTDPPPTATNPPPPTDPPPPTATNPPPPTDPPPPTNPPPPTDTPVPQPLEGSASSNYWALFTLYLFGGTITP